MHIYKCYFFSRLIITFAITYSISSVIETLTTDLYPVGVFFFNSSFILRDKDKKGWPVFKLLSEISLYETPSLNPVPRALTNASFDA